MYRLLHIIIILLFVMQPAYVLANEDIKVSEYVEENLTNEIEELDGDGTGIIIEGHEEENEIDDLLRDNEKDLIIKNEGIEEENQIIQIESDNTNKSQNTNYVNEKLNDGEITIQQTNVKSPTLWYEEAMNENSASKRVDIFIEAFEHYPNNEMIINGLESSVRNLLNWASNRHIKGEFETAIDRYDKIISINGIKQDLIDEAIWKKSYAENKQLYPNADELYELAMSITTVSGRLDAFINAYNEVFPKNDRLKEGIHTSAQNLLDWAIQKHNQGDFLTAINRYEKILNAPTLLNSTRTIAQVRLEEAKEEKRPADIIYQEAKNETILSKQLELFLEGYNSYNNDTRFISGVETSSKSLFDWAKKQHQNGNYTTAIDRYNRILNISIISQELRESVTLHLEYANINQKTPTIETILNHAKKENRASYKLSLYIEGYRLYPDADTIIKGIHESAEALLRWSINKHHSGDFENAIDRYRFILSAPTLPDKIKNETNKKLAEAEMGKRPADVIYDFIKKETTASGQFDLYNEGYKFYPNDKRFIQGLALSAEKLLKLSIRYHSLEDFDNALSRYEKLLSSEGVPNNIKSKAEILKKYSNESIYPSIPFYLTEVANEITASGKLKISLEAYLLYENDEKVINSVLENAHILLNWATQRHQNGEFEIALDRYNIILELPVMEERLKREVETKRKFALNNNKIPTADALLEEANNENRASYKFNIFVEGMILYSNDERFVKGVIDSSQSLLNLAKRYHEDKRFSDAVSRYETVLSALGLPEKIRLEAEYRKKYAEKNIQIPSLDEILYDAKNESTLSRKFNKYLEGYILYPTDKDIINKLIFISYDLYNYTYNLHAKKNYTAAISRYEILLNSPGVPDYIKEFANVNLKNAKLNKPPVSEVVNYINYNINLMDALDKQMKTSPQTDKSQYAWVHKSYIDSNHRVTVSELNVRTQPSTVNSKENYVIGTLSKGTKVDIVGEHGDWYAIKYNNGRHWIHAIENDVLYYLNPNNFVNNSIQIFQFLDLSKPSGATKYDLNKYLKGKGSLEGQGEAFINAARLYGVNDIYLISHALLETGNGTSDLATGKIKVGEIDKNKKYVVVLPGNKIYIVNNGITSRNDNFKLNGIILKPIYNMFGIGAVDSNPLILGAVRAYKEGWFKPENGIIGGAAFIGNNYIYAGQNTLYKMRWNPYAMDNLGYATHQYATDIGWASKQVNRIYTIYNEVGLTVPILEIPVYK